MISFLMVNHLYMPFVLPKKSCSHPLPIPILDTVQPLLLSANKKAMPELAWLKKLGKSSLFKSLVSIVATT